MFAQPEPAGAGKRHGLHHAQPEGETLDPFADSRARSELLFAQFHFTVAFGRSTPSIVSLERQADDIADEFPFD